jgi:hypothetical protein
MASYSRYVNKNDDVYTLHSYDKKSFQICINPSFILSSEMRNLLPEDSVYSEINSSAVCQRFTKKIVDQFNNGVSKKSAIIVSTDDRIFSVYKNADKYDRSYDPYYDNSYISNELALLSLEQWNINIVTINDNPYKYIGNYL